ncbi:hypothetical protein KY347_06610 [Candidatus Woesearchaeota archaeon]|nr:hypothetical protein [Candidatus Woesearchaeota archaeon]
MTIEGAVRGVKGLMKRHPGVQDPLLAVTTGLLQKGYSDLDTAKVLKEIASMKDISRVLLEGTDTDPGRLAEILHLDLQAGYDSVFRVLTEGINPLPYYLNDLIKEAGITGEENVAKASREIMEVFNKSASEENDSTIWKVFDKYSINYDGIIYVLRVNASKILQEKLKAPISEVVRVLYNRGEGVKRDGIADILFDELGIKQIGDIFDAIYLGTNASFGEAAKIAYKAVHVAGEDSLGLNRLSAIGRHLKETKGLNPVDITGIILEGSGAWGMASYSETIQASKNIGADYGDIAIGLKRKSDELGWKFSFDDIAELFYEERVPLKYNFEALKKVSANELANKHDKLGAYGKIITALVNYADASPVECGNLLKEDGLDLGDIFRVYREKLNYSFFCVKKILRGVGYTSGDIERLGIPENFYNKRESLRESPDSLYCTEFFQPPKK